MDTMSADSNNEAGQKESGFVFGSQEPWKAKKSLGQHYLVDQNYVNRILDALQDDSEGGMQVVELGAGKGELTAPLLERFPKILAVEIDRRAIARLEAGLPELDVVQGNLLKIDWQELATERQGRVSVISNLPYYITSATLFSLVKQTSHIRQAVITMQLEVGERILVSPNSKDYGILSVMLQLYAAPELLFHIPAQVYRPPPKVTSCCMRFTYPEDAVAAVGVEPASMLTLLQAGFRKRRKMLRQSLKPLLEPRGLVLSNRWATKRPEQLSPEEFVELHHEIFGAPKKVQGGDTTQP